MIIKKKDKKVNHLFTPPAAHNCLCGTSSLALKTFPNEIKPSIGCPAKEKQKRKIIITAARRRESRR